MISGYVNRCVTYKYNTYPRNETRQQRVVALEESLSKARSISKPKSKFSFKSTAHVRPAGLPSTNVAPSTEQPAPTSSEVLPGSGSTRGLATELTLTNLTHRYLTLNDAAGADLLSGATPTQSLVITIKGLSNCFVDLTRYGIAKAKTN
jgi:hypothetical protein